jgi:surface antigen
VTTAGQVLDVARSQIGTVEDSAGRTKYAAAYDPALNGQAWCAMFTWWVFREAGGVDLIPKAAYTPAYLSAFQSRGQSDRTPRPGSLVFYNWPDAVNRVQHVGIVEAVNADGSIVTIEGNTTSGVAGDQSHGGGVWRRRRSTSAVVGYGHPAYAGQVGPVTDRNPANPAAGLATLQFGMQADSRVIALQRWLNAYNWRPALPLLPPTGNYGEQTVAVVRGAQAQCGVGGPDANGRIVGPRTIAAFAARGARW